MSRPSGYAYLFFLFLLSLLSLSLLAVASLQHYARIRADEAELLRIGREYRTALVRYYGAAEPRMLPSSLDELLLDQRAGRPLRHLRKIYFDPMTRQQEWGLVREGGRIVGIHSLSERAPMKIAGFEPEEAEFEGAGRYADWVFRVLPAGPAAEQPPVTPLPGATGG